jgi:hypothetical protein
MLSGSPRLLPGRPVARAAARQYTVGATPVTHAAFGFPLCGTHKGHHCQEIPIARWAALGDENGGAHVAR